MRRAGLVLFGLLGCHADLRLPPEPRTPEQRVAAYRQLAALDEEARDDLSGGNPHVLVIGDGRLIDHIEDVIPLVPAGSATADNARRAACQRRAKNIWFVTASIVGGAGAFAGEMTIFTGQPPLVVPFALLGLGAVALAIGIHENTLEKRSERAAFDTYNADLATALKVCTRGTSVVPCE